MHSSAHIKYTHKTEPPNLTSVRLVAGHFGLDLSLNCPCLPLCVWLALCEEQPSVCEESSSCGWLFVRNKAFPAFFCFLFASENYEMKCDQKRRNVNSDSRFFLRNRAILSIQSSLFNICCRSSFQPLNGKLYIY